jgi:hypothetical protein
MVMLRRLRELIRGRDGTGLWRDGSEGSQKSQAAPETGRPPCRAARQMHWLFRLSMIFTENRFTLFGIMLVRRLPGELAK